MAGRPWSKKHSAYVRDHYRKQSVREIAKHVGRTPSAVYQHAFKIGVAETCCKKEVAKRDKKIRELHAKGWSASEIGAVVGIGTRTINGRLHKIGLTPHGRSERYRRRVAEKTKEQCQVAGVKNLGELRSKEMKRVAQQLGWPDHLSLRSVQILETLYQRGPMTRKQIAAAIGMKWVGSRKSLGNNRVPGGSYLAELQRAGLVVRLESAITHQGKGNHQDVYLVGLGVEPCQKARSKYQS